MPDTPTSTSVSRIGRQTDLRLSVIEIPLQHERAIPRDVMCTYTWSGLWYCGQVNHNPNIGSIGETDVTSLRSGEGFDSISYGTTVAWCANSYTISWWARICLNLRDLVSSAASCVSKPCSDSSSSCVQKCLVL